MALTSVIPLATSARAVVLADNLSASQDSSSSVTTSLLRAIEFTTDATNYHVDSITVRVSLQTGKTVKLDIYTDNGGKPGTLVQAMGQLDANTTFLVFNNGGSGAQLSPNTNYWAVARTTADSFQWRSSATLTGTGSGFHGPSQLSNNTGGTWTLQTNLALLHQVVASSGDIFTETPTLTTPTSSTTIAANPLTVAYTLPEAALNGSVKLHFFNTTTSTPYDLTVANSEGTSGAHSISFPASNPTSSPSIVAGAALPDGVYNVSFEYQDAAGHPAATSNTATAVTLDTATLTPDLTAPTAASYTTSLPVSFSLPEAALAGSVQLIFQSSGPDRVITLGTPAEGSGSHSFTLDLQDPTATAGGFVTSGSTIPNGTYNVVLSYQDALGNSAATDSQSGIVVHVPIGNPGYASVYAKGGAVPGAGVDPRIPADAVWTTLNSPAVNNAGQVAYWARWKSTGSSGAGVFVDDTLIVAIGDEVPDSEGLKFKTFKNPVIDDNGNIAFIGTISGTGVTLNNDTVVVTTGRTGSIEILAREGDSAPGTSGTFKLFQSVSIASGEVATRPGAEQANLVLGAQSGTAFTAQISGNGSGAWWLPAGESELQLLVHPGDSVNGATGTVRSFQLLKTLHTSPGQGRGLIDGDEAVIQVVMSSGDQVVASAQPGTLDAIVQTGDTLGGTALPAAVWRKLGLPSTGNHGEDLSLLGELQKGPENVVSTNATGIFSSDDAGSTWEPVARLSDPAPGFPVDAKFLVFKNPVNSTTDAGVAFVATAKGGAVTTTSDTGIWWQPAGSSLSLVAQEGALPPDAPAGAKWKSFDSLALPGGATGPLFTAHLTPGAGGITTASDVGLYGADSEGSLRELLREGVTILGKTVRSFSVLTASSGSAGTSRSFNASGTVAVLVTFTDASTGIVKINVP